MSAGGAATTRRRALCSSWPSTLAPLSPTTSWWGLLAEQQGAASADIVMSIFPLNKAELVALESHFKHSAHRS